MKNHTDSCIVEYNEDGSRTETTVVTYQPVTKGQQFAAVAGLIGLCLAPVVPYVGLALYEKYEERRENRREAKKQKSA